MAQVLYCRDGAVIAWHDDRQNIPADAYGANVEIVPYEGSLDSLGRVGPPPDPPWKPSDGDPRPYAAPGSDKADHRFYEVSGKPPPEPEESERK
jgi:hypothetical protein